jgi:hypothetical protein
MRIRRPSAIVLASAAALGVGLIAFPASSAAAPPVVPSCTFPDTTGSDSCATFRVNAFDAPFGGAFEPASLGFRVRTRFETSSEINSVRLQFHQDIKFNLAAVGAECPSSELPLNLGKDPTLAAAWEQCGPGADGNPPSEDNAYLSTGLGTTVISGVWHSAPATGGGSGFFACSMIFKGADNTHVTILGRAPFDSPSDCDNPATNTGGCCSHIFTGTLSHLPVSSAYDWTLTVPNISQWFARLDDLYLTLKRGVAFEGRCTDTPPTPFRMVAVWDYTAADDVNDVRGATHLCPH